MNNEIKIHEPGCKANTACLVVHADGKQCSGECTCKTSEKVAPVRKIEPLPAPDPFLALAHPSLVIMWNKVNELIKHLNNV